MRIQSAFENAGIRFLANQPGGGLGSTQNVASADMEVNLASVTHVTSSDFIPIIKTSGNSFV
jgi:hypothetical protein